MTKKEQEILKYMKNLDLSREEAEQLWLDDHSDTLTEEQAELTAKAKANNKRHYEKNIHKKRNVQRERKVDTEKLVIMQTIMTALPQGVTDVQLVNELKINFRYNEHNYSLMLTRHRK